VWPHFLYSEVKTTKMFNLRLTAWLKINLGCIYDKLKTVLGWYKDDLKIVWISSLWWLKLTNTGKKKRAWKRSANRDVARNLLREPRRGSGWWESPRAVQGSRGGGYGCDLYRNTMKNTQHANTEINTMKTYDKEKNTYDDGRGEGHTPMSPFGYPLFAKSIARGKKLKKNMPKKLNLKKNNDKLSRLVGGPGLPRVLVACSACGAIVYDSWLVSRDCQSCSGRLSLQYIVTVIASRVVFYSTVALAILTILLCI